VRNRDVETDLLYYKNKLRKLGLEKAERHMIRSRVQQLEEGERCTSYFAGLEKHRAKNNTVFSLLDNYNNMVRNQEEVLDTQVKYYTDLYKLEPIDELAQELLLSNLEQKVYKEDALACDRNIRLDECRNAISQLKCNKTPGTDGLTAEFYKNYFDIIGHDYLEVMNYAFRKGELSATPKRGAITLIYKK